MAECDKARKSAEVAAHTIEGGREPAFHSVSLLGVGYFGHFGGLRGEVSSWTSPSSITPLPPFLSLFRFLSAGSVYVGVGGIGVRGLGITRTSGAAIPVWDSSRESSFFSITIPSGTQVSLWSALTRVIVSWGLSPSFLGMLVW